jgi:hypothetical protein
VEQRFTSYGRSNISVDDAKRDGQERLDRVRKKLRGDFVPPKQDYSVDIREEIIDEMNPLNVITRNRYGALVWNTTQYTVLDIDAVRPRPNFWEILGLKKRQEPKAIIMDNLQEMVKRSAYRDLGFRVYETAQGYRVVVLGRYFEPGTPDFRRLIKDSYTDWLYADICISQNCYRARLTPKPYRIGIERMHFKWPMTPDAYTQAQTWLQAYTTASEPFATCRYVTTLGLAVTAPDLGFHDHPSGAQTCKPLA